jgi:hypothetical protein
MVNAEEFSYLTTPFQDIPSAAEYYYVVQELNFCYGT